MTKKQKWLARRFLAYRAFTNMWFFGAVWIYFYRLYINDQQIGMLDALAFAIGLLAEVPSGALADKFGRDKMVRLGQVLTASGLLIQIAGSSFAPFVVGQAVMMIGVAFVSGADEALFFEKLTFKPASLAWRKLVTRGVQVSLTATLIATAVGGYLHMVNPRLPWILTALSFVAAAILIWPIKDERAKQIRQPFMPEVKSYLRDIRTGFLQFRLPGLWVYVPVILALQGVFYAADAGVLRLILLSRFHFDPFWGAMLVAGCGVVAVAALAVVHKYAKRISEGRVIITIALATTVGLLASIADIGLWGWVVILALYLGDNLIQPFMSEILNRHAPEQQRATVLSVASFLKSLPYVVLAPVIGWLNVQGKLSYFLLTWSLLIVGALSVFLITKRRNSGLSGTALALVETSERGRL